MKTCACGVIADKNTDSYDTIRLVRKCEDCMDDKDWRIFYAKQDLENQ